MTQFFNAKNSKSSLHPNQVISGATQLKNTFVERTSENTNLTPNQRTIFNMQKLHGNAATIRLLKNSANNKSSQTDAFDHNHLTPQEHILPPGEHANPADLGESEQDTNADTQKHTLVKAKSTSPKSQVDNATKQAASGNQANTSAQKSAPTQGKSTALIKSTSDTNQDKLKQTTNDAPQTDGEGKAIEADVHKQNGPHLKLELKMPEPPDGTTPKHQARLAAVGNRAQDAVAAHTNLPSAATHVQDARAAVDEPHQETNAHAQGKLVDVLVSEQSANMQTEALKAEIRDAIHNQRPTKQDDFGKADSDAMARTAGKEIEGSVASKAQHASQSLNKLQNVPPGSPEQKAQSLHNAPDTENKPDVDAKQAAPDPSPEPHTDLTADVSAQQKQIDEAGMNTEPAKLVKSGPVADVREAQGQLADSAKDDPTRVAAQQQVAIAKAQNDMDALQARALADLQQSRGNTVRQTSDQQHSMVDSEEQQRQQVGEQANQIFGNAQKQIDDLLGAVPETAMRKWDSKLAIASSHFKTSLKVVDDWIKDRHSGVIGELVDIGDSVFGLPPAINEAYDHAEQQFGDEICDALTEISSDVNKVIATCHQIVGNAHAGIDQLFSTLPTNLQEWEQQQKVAFGQKLDSLNLQADQTRQTFGQQIRHRAGGAVHDVREQVEALRDKAKGLISQIEKSVGAFVDNPAKFIINGLLEVAGIGADVFWTLIAKIEGVVDQIAKDPMKFANNLVESIKNGFQKFIDNFGTHIIDGLFSWLFDALQGTPLKPPADLSLESLFGFVLDVLGISWEHIRTLIARYIGEDKVEQIENAVSTIQNLMAMGPQGILEMLKEVLDPQHIIDMVIQKAKDYLLETVIKNAIATLVESLNPAGGIIQGVKMIKNGLQTIFQRAARLFRVVQTLTDGCADIMSGNIDPLAGGIDQALSQMLPMVITFLADELGLGDVPEKVAGLIKEVRKEVDRALDMVVGTVAKAAAPLLDKVGIEVKDPHAKDEKKAEGAHEPNPQLTDAITYIHQKEKAYSGSDGVTKQGADQAAADAKQHYAMLFSELNVIKNGEVLVYNYTPASTAVQRIELTDSPMPRHLPRAGTWLKDDNKGGYRELRDDEQRGNGYWVPNKEAAQNYVKETKLPGIAFIDGYPQFRPWAKAVVPLSDMTGDNTQDFRAAYIALGTKWANPDEKLKKPNDKINKSQVKRRIVELFGKCTWHHHQGENFMLLIPTDLHANVPHTGGASAARSQNVDDD